MRGNRAPRARHSPSAVGALSAGARALSGALFGVARDRSRKQKRRPVKATSSNRPEDDARRVDSAGAGRMQGVSSDRWGQAAYQLF
jgi:hypothetical protein